jgi:hypothetical protein
MSRAMRPESAAHVLKRARTTAAYTADTAAEPLRKQPRRACKQSFTYLECATTQAGAATSAGLCTTCDTKRTRDLDAPARTGFARQMCCKCELLSAQCRPLVYELGQEAVPVCHYCRHCCLVCYRMSATGIAVYDGHPLARCAATCTPRPNSPEY